MCVYDLFPSLRSHLKNKLPTTDLPSFGKTNAGSMFSTQPIARSLFPRRAAWAVGACVGLTGAALATTETGRGARRFMFTVYTASYILADYKVNRGDRENRGELHKRSAGRLLELCREYGGVFVKAGQYVGTMNHILPKEYTKTLSQLQDCAPSRPWEAIKGVVEKEYNDSISSIFEVFSETPVAAASLAQVHYARTNARYGSREVAVKIQYPGLAKQVEGDLWTMKVISSIVGTLFPDYQYGWLLPEFEKVAEEELDFLNEARNGQRTKAMLAKHKDVYVPEVHLDISTKRVLAMEWINGVRVSNVDVIEGELGFSSRNVAKTLFKIFGEMIYVHGFVHCDPHPGNLMVRPDPKYPKSRYQVVVLDHGMYRELSEPFRVAYCNLWKALVTNDADLGRRSVEEMKMPPEYYDFLSLLLTFRPSTSTTKLGERMSKTERRRIRKQFKGTTVKDVNTFMENLPRDLLFVLRSTDILRSLNKDMGGKARDRFIAMSDSAMEGLGVSSVTVFMWFLRRCFSWMF